MRSDKANARLVPSALLLASLILSACGGGGVSTIPATGLAVVPAPAITSTGTEYYLTLPDHLCVSSPAQCNNNPVTNKLIIAAAAATSGEVTFNGVIKPFSVAAGAEIQLTLDPAVVLTSNESVEAKGIHVTALAPISVHVVSENATSADGYLALPTAGLGTNYYVMSYASTRYAGSEFAVVATQNSTTVTITPSAAGSSKPAGTTFTILLNAGETYQFQNPANADMTGTNLSSDKPVAVFSGHRCADVPSGVGYCDYLVEQLADVSLWGKTFHTSPFSGRSRYTVRVISSQDGTTFTTIPAGLIGGTLNAGLHKDVVLSGDAEIVSSNPVLVAQFMHGYADDASAKGDPSMVLVTPAEMGMTDATFGVYGLARTPGTNPSAYMNVVTETAALATLKLDNTAVDTGLFTPLGGTSIYSVGTIPVTSGVHSLSGTLPYSALVYDYGISRSAVSYAYPVATALSFPVAPPATTGCGNDDHDKEHQHDDDQTMDRNHASALDQSNQTNHATEKDRGAENDDGQECH